MVENLIISNPLLFLGVLYSLAFGLNILLNKFKLPHVLFYLLVGFAAGNFLFTKEFSDPNVTQWFHTVEILALGLIGFQIGTELRFNLMRKQPRVISVLLSGDIVGTLVIAFVIMLLFTQDVLLSIMLAALATSTAPATTMGVIKRLKAKGELTQMVQWILAFDDVISVIIVEAILVIEIVVLGGNPSFREFLGLFGHEIIEAIALGLVIGYILDRIIEKMGDRLEMMEITLAVVILAIGIGEYVHTSAITLTMTMGAVTTNTGGDNYKDAHELLDILMSPILALFFILIGSKVAIIDFYNPFPWIAVFYLAARSIGKFSGVYLGGRILDLEEPMRSSIGMSLLSQGGVVLGLASISNEIFTELGNPELGTMILSAVILSTIASEILGALGTDYAIRRNHEEFKDNNFLLDRPDKNTEEEFPPVHHE